MKENEQLSNHHRAEIMNVVREEYQSLRSEISEHLKATYLIGAAIVTLLTAGFYIGSITWKDNAFLSASIFNGVVPTLLFTAAIGTSYAFGQMGSIGEYIKSGIEDKITFLFDSEFQGWLKEKCLKTGLLPSWRIIDWEGHIKKTRRTSKRGRQRDTIVFGIVFGLSLVVSVVAGYTRMFIDDRWLWLNTPHIVHWFLVSYPLVLVPVGVFLCWWVKRPSAYRRPLCLKRKS